jgi:hypothetical protein
MSDDSNLPAQTTGSLPAGLSDDDYGLEDFGTEDFVMPRLNIKHGDAVFVDNLTGQEYPEMTVVLLGLIKQRILWDADVDEGERPLCKSYDFNHGRPEVERFPYKVSGFDKGAVSAEGTLPCSSCQLKEWGSHPQRETPWCSEQHTFPLLMEVAGGYAPAILTLQRSGIKPSRAYLSAFARTKTPLFTVKTKLALTAQKRGSVNYAVPTFVKQDDTDENEWQGFAAQYRSIREFITTPPAPKVEEDEPAASVPASPAAAAAAASDESEDLPF